jgi:hypothetical protein
LLAARGALEQPAQHGERDHPVLARGRHGAGQRQECRGAGQRPPAARNLLLYLHHAQVAFGLIVIERDARVIEGAQGLVAMDGQPGWEDHGCGG